jgi:hypothetical protein
MSWTQRGVLVILVGLAGLVVIGRVSRPKQAPGSRSESPMKGAVFAAAIPVYPGAKLSDIMGGEYKDDVGGPAIFTSQSWFFAITDPVAAVAEYYRAHLPEGYRPREAEAGEVAFEWTPTGAVDGEIVHVTIRDGQLQIGEKVKVKGKP